MSFTQFKLEDSPTAEECRAVLGDLPTAKEKRKGKAWYIFIYLILINGGGLIFLFSLDSRMNETLLGIIWFSIFALMIISSAIAVGYEGKLVNNNKVDDLIDFIQPYLKEDERFLAMVFGHAFGRINVKWIKKDINRYSYFIFTTDRLIVITFSPHFIDTDQIANTITNGTFKNGIQDVYTCSLSNKEEVKYGGLMKHVTGFFICTPIKIVPTKQTGLNTWYLADKHTANGKLIKTIFKRLSNKRNF